MKPGFMNPQPFDSVIEFGQPARDKIKRGLDTVCNAARLTIGPKGRNAFIDGEWEPQITNDGVTIIAKIRLSDKVEDLGAQAAKQAAAATNDAAGDGTTTTAILLQEVVAGAFASRENPMVLRDQLNAAADEAIAMVKAQAVPVKTDEDILNIATISAESVEIGQMVSDIVKQVGNDGLITIEPSQGNRVEHQLVSGFQLRRGYAVSQFQNNADLGQCILDETPVLVTGKTIGVIQNLIPIIEKLSKGGATKLAVFCTDMDDGVVANLVVNKQAGRFQSVVVKGLTPEELADVAALTDATMNIDFDALEVSDLGKAPKVAVGEKQTVITGCTPPDLHIAQLNATGNSNENLVQREASHERAKRLKGKMAIIKVGAPVDSEAKYLLAKIEDAVQAVKAAADGGIVPGGGATLFRIGTELLGKPDEGSRIVGKALQEPMLQILRNAGENVSNVAKLFAPTTAFSSIDNLPDDHPVTAMGWDAKNGRWANLLDSGIIDPAKVEIEAIRNAVHAAATLATAEVAITFKLAEGVSVK